jgi:hypothetical protein
VKGLSIPAKGERRSMRNLTRTEDIGSVPRDRSFVTDAPHKLEIERYDEASSWRTRLMPRLMPRLMMKHGACRSRAIAVRATAGWAETTGAKGARQALSPGFPD